MGERDPRIGVSDGSYRLIGVLLHDDPAPRHGKGALAGLTVGMIGGIAACVSRFEYCYPYTAMWGATSVGYYLPLGTTTSRMWRSASVREVQ
jgi:hypothetical protein